MALPQNSACYYFGLNKAGTGYGKISLLLKNMGRRKDIIYTSSQLQLQEHMTSSMTNGGGSKT